MSVEAAKFDGVVENNAFIFWNFLLSGKAAEEVILGPGDEEGFLVVNPTEPGEVGVALVEAVDAVRDDGKFFSGNGNLMAFAIGDGEERRDLAGIVQAIMELDGSLGGAELGPGEGGEAEIDDGCIQQVERIFEPEPMLKAILDSFSGWSVLGIQKFEGCRCGGDLVNLELKIRLHHSHEVKDGRFVIEQLLGVESDNQAHLDKHFSGFSRKSKAQENIMVVAISKASIKLEGEYQLWVEEEKCANEIKIDQWKAILNETVARLVEAKETKEQVQ